MAKKRTHKSRKRKTLPASDAGDSYLLDSFSSLGLRALQAAGEDIIEFEIFRYHALEALRQLHKPDLVEALGQIEPCIIDVQDWARIVDYRYSSTPLSAAGSLKRGGRFNIGMDCDRSSVARFPALYIAGDHETALLERFGQAGTASELSGVELALRARDSYSFVRLHGRINRVLDLHRARDLSPFTQVIMNFRLPKRIDALGRKLGYPSPHIVKRSSVLLATLLAKDWRYLPTNHGLPANPQIFAALVQEAGFEAICYESARKGRKCLAIFPEKLDRSDSWIELADPAPASVAITRLDSRSWQNLI